MAERKVPEEHGEESVKLFVGQVPKEMTEDQLLAMFREFALVDGVSIIRDKATRASRGCCFLICPSKEEADKAVDAYHNKKTLPGASSPLQVKYADGELERLEHKLFVGMLPKDISEASLSALFSQYGTIKEMQILRGSQQTSKGCAFVKFESREQALAAIDALNGIHIMEGSTVALVVKWADTEKERNARKAQRTQSLANATQHSSMFGALPMGYVPPYNGYGYQAPRTYGLMQYRLPPLHNQHAFHSGIRPINQSNALHGVSPNLSPGIGPKNYAMPPMSYLRSGYPPVPRIRYPMAYAGGAKIPFDGSNSAPPSTAINYSAASSSVNASEGQVEGPSGANLFIYQIPQGFGDQELANAFKPFGFVSYDSPAAAQAAIDTMNGCQLDGKKLKVQLKRDNRQSKAY